MPEGCQLLGPYKVGERSRSGSRVVADGGGGVGIDQASSGTLAVSKSFT